jgi:hypothetical protein
LRYCNSQRKKRSVSIDETKRKPSRANLVDALAEHIGVAPLTPAEVESVLSLAAVAAHGTGDRTTAPLASFLAGLSAEQAEDRVASLGEVRRRATELAPPPEEG